MDVTESHPTDAQRSQLFERTGVVVPLNRGARAQLEAGALTCVSSGYLAGEGSCRCTVPGAVVRAAWAGELALDGNNEDRLFHFAWRDEVWLAYGLAGGDVRGVYCPTHRAAREAHAVGRTPKRASRHAVAVGA
jgi:hypothetical protein